MKLGEAIQKQVIPVVSVITAFLVAWVNFQAQTNQKLIEKQEELAQVRQQEIREQQEALQLKLQQIDSEIKLSREEREERESNQEFNLKIYEIVTRSIEERNTQKQEAAKAFIVVMVEEPLRTSLLNVLKQGGDESIRANVSKILQSEESFKSGTGAVVQKTYDAVASYAWRDWDFDLFYCAASGPQAKLQAEKIGDRLKAEGAEGRIRVRELPESLNAKAGYRISGYHIRYNEGNELDTAQALKRLADTTLGEQTSFELSVSNQKTSWYLSAFVCPTS
ncbi:hypothetical protein FLL45_07655 [Aliikangiella marina]|uniref:Uncharacterized protein n=1 Tax=Aliikangiella marina TaxID=1712262 RepID=A0A545TC82_9GAMM|nr:hypothetical protein [Aliikangiella marina]TQV74827.1 hypothetical protein FLL45_07655 [Aliikangiella marina]